MSANSNMAATEIKTLFDEWEHSANILYTVDGIHLFKTYDAIKYDNIVFDDFI